MSYSSSSEFARSLYLSLKLNIHTACLMKCRSTKLRVIVNSPFFDVHVFFVRNMYVKSMRLKLDKN